MTVGPLFTTSALNVARAAVRQAEQTLAADAPVETRVGSHEAGGTASLYVEISSRAGDAQQLDVDDATISACLAEPDHETSHRMVSEFVDQLAGEIKSAVRTQLDHDL